MKGMCDLRLGGEILLNSNRHFMRPGCGGGIREQTSNILSVELVEPLAQAQRLKISRLGKGCQPLANDSPSCSPLSSR